ncbi:UDP-N-acetylglucosamine transferase subunit ALG13 [Amphibacillus marinus]|uniref:UDP-N-acetylglucosamine transferase subunit ALG13 n=1 Tax=Amphibacillus marinus TaxID=872970 RepID=A0A1H8N3Y7_9BACI|nr:PssE/Cps14G family polysaccharide biosynthesis glycosyltransferase [Amphibacillus marinus]SEO24317.1 UDP-N-acetylglucosamine transferase subunit ALG13 [Amphibacillus marinus]
MIFVVLGTHELPFNRLLIEVEKLIANGLIKEQVIVQTGHTKYASPLMDIYNFVSYDQMDKWFEQASYIISHAGTGSVLTGLKKGKTVIAVPRLSKFKEHNDDHQLQIVDALSNQGHILPCHDLHDLPLAVKMVQSFQPKPFESGRDKLCALLQKFIEQF